MGADGSKEYLERAVPVLSEVPFFGHLNEREIKALAKLCSLEAYGKGETLFEQGDYGRELYVILTGSVIVSVRTELGVRWNAMFTSILVQCRVHQ